MAAGLHHASPPPPHCGWWPAWTRCESGGTSSRTPRASPGSLGGTWARFGTAEAITPALRTVAPAPCSVIRSSQATTGRAAANVSTATSPCSSPWPGSDVRWTSSPVSAQRPMSYHLVSSPASVRSRSSTRSHEPFGADAVHDGTSWVAGKPMSTMPEVHRVYGQVPVPPPNGSR